MSIRRFLAGTAIASLAIVGLAPTSLATEETETQVYLSPSGSDEGDGSAEQPLRSLAGAVSLLGESDTERATIWVDAGVYYETAVVQWRVPQDELTLRPLNDGERPVFDGSRASGNSHYWMNTAGGPRLDVEGMEVRNYRTGGIRMDTDGNVIHDVVFHQIGNKHVPDGPGYAALHLLGSSHNHISDVVFRDLENVDCPGCMHGVYAANGSSDNVVTGSEFTRITGDPVRLRNDTHRNVFEYNTFSRSGDHMLDEERGEPGRWPHRAMASFWLFNDREVCGTENRVDFNVSDGRTYHGKPGQRMIGSHAEQGLERCPLALKGRANTNDPHM